MAFRRVVRTFSVGFKSSSSSSSSTCRTLVFPFSLAGLICKNSLPARTASSRVGVCTASRCLCSGRYPSVLPKISTLILALCSWGRSAYAMLTNLSTSAACSCNGVRNRPFSRCHLPWFLYGSCALSKCK